MGTRDEWESEARAETWGEVFDMIRAMAEREEVIKLRASGR